ncbi:coiled-coil domain-containing protein R3HCC1L isoform X2 [Cimex lectularius]|uniref:R3H domain-containing protein n=2 Tax=Cimex lectularius TaxID=79782 RepID=A0A8I6SMN6_CIMLE|nr:coiled-coil domain-containing protein R3HCC1L isoform X1 [Cimex lectularius]XP_024083874.1 coiled-coil domain-containing protein R3HCC1L isoform X2 [Cimex lectularius]
MISLRSDDDCFAAERLYEKISIDLEHFLKGQEDNSVLIFPAVNNYKRFLIHNFVQKFYDGLDSFSIGVAERRRVVVYSRAKASKIMDSKEQPPVTIKRRIPEGHYIPPPARKALLQNEEQIKERVRVAQPKIDNKDSRKACNDSSLLFQEGNAKSQRTSKKVKPKQTQPKQGKTEVQECTNSSKIDVKRDNNETSEKSVLNELETSKCQVQELNPKASDIVLKLDGYSEKVNTKLVQKEEVVEKKEEGKTKVKNKKPKAKAQKENKLEQNMISASSSCDNEITSKKKSVTPKQVKNLPMEVEDWESLCDDLGDDSLTTAEVNEITEKVGKMKVCKAKEKYTDDSNDECGTIIEIYGFNEEIKTSDLIAIFGSYASRGFNLKWVDDTHALGIFASPRLAEEVLNTDLPMIKTRPLHKASQQSQAKARTMVLPSALRPKTCTALARRLVSGALGVKLSVTPEQRAAENKLLREARETRKQAAKDRDAAWEGNFSSK